MKISKLLIHLAVEDGVTIILVHSLLYASLIASSLSLLKASAGKALISESQAWKDLKVCSDSDALIVAFSNCHDGLVQRVTKHE